MTPKQQEQFKKFKEFARWMYSDSELALYLVQAQFLVALALFNYIEILGAFYSEYFQKDTKGVIKLHKRKNKTCKGCSECVNGKLKTTSTDRFNHFFSYLGNEYQNLLKAHKEIYNELRCGLSHEFLPKNRQFTIYHAGTGTFTKEQIDNNSPLISLVADNLTNNLDGSRVSCGVVLLKYKGQEIWQVFVPKLAADFRRGVKNFIRKIEDGRDKKLLKNFFETANQINLKNFKTEPCN